MTNIPSKYRAMTTTRLQLLRNSRPSDLCLPSSSSAPTYNLSHTKVLKCSLRLGSDAQNQKPSFKEKERKSPVEVKASSSESVITTSKTVDRRGLMDLVFLVTQVTDIVLTELRQVIKRRAWKLQMQRHIERVILDCRFFSIFAVAGTLLGSVLCFFEGCCRILECYRHCVSGLLHGAKGNTLHNLIEALDIFLFGTSMLALGMGFYNMFVVCRTNKSNHYPRGCVAVESIGEAKTRIGYAVVMILHVGMVEKFMTTPLLTCMDLACFAASLFISSASMFLISKLFSLEFKGPSSSRDT